MPRVTMRQVANLAGTSPTTVSHVLNHTPGAAVAAATRQRVLRVAQQLGYQRGLLASAIKEPLRLIGVALGRQGQPDEIDTDRIFSGIRAELLDRNHFPVVQALPAGVGEADSPAAVARMLDLHGQKLVSGFILDKQCFSDPSTVRLYDRGVPIVLVNGKHSLEGGDGQPLPAVVCDYLSGAITGTQYLLGLGHRRIALLTRPCRRYPETYWPFLIQRLQEGFAGTLAAAGAPAPGEWIAEADPRDREEIYAAVRRLQGRERPPTAWFVTDDSMAIMVMHALQSAGLRIPQDASVLGFGGWEMGARLSEPPLTTLQVPLEENGRQAVRLLFNQLREVPLAPRQRFLQPVLQVRGSTAAAPPAPR
ncbi:MAG: LacI family DNA-binding transcriptional regulator [Lentisphaeria bacterium]|jgi:DNA-binding LacI/PurR family transcriptional regulator